MTRDETWLLNEKYHGEKTEGFFADSKRLEAGEPLAYVIGHIPFLNTTISLDSKPLIPRPETEYWVEKILSQIQISPSPDIRGQTPNMRVLDACAGSGCIGVAVAKAFPDAHVDFVEIDESHHSTILRNIRENGIDESHTHIMGGNLFEKVKGVYDLILSNPPYIHKELGRTDTSVLAHEPHGALFAEEGGFALIKRIMEDALPHLTPKGHLIVEHEPEHVSRIEECGARLGYEVTTKNDQYGVPRYTRMTRILR